VLSPFDRFDVTQHVCKITSTEQRCSLRCLSGVSCRVIANCIRKPEAWWSQPECGGQYHCVTFGVPLQVFGLGPHPCQFPWDVWKFLTTTAYIQHICNQVNKYSCNVNYEMDITMWNSKRNYTVNRPPLQLAIIFTYTARLRQFLAQMLPRK